MSICQDCGTEIEEGLCLCDDCLNAGFQLWIKNDAAKKDGAE